MNYVRGEVKRDLKIDKNKEVKNLILAQCLSEYNEGRSITEEWLTSYKTLSQNVI